MFFISLASAFHSIGENRKTTSLDDRIEKYLTLQTDKSKIIFDFANDIMEKNASQR